MRDAHQQPALCHGCHRRDAARRHVHARCLSPRIELLVGRLLAVGRIVFCHSVLALCTIVGLGFLRSLLTMVLGKMRCNVAHRCRRGGLVWRLAAQLAAVHLLLGIQRNGSKVV